MTTAVLYLFIFSTWGLGLLSWIVLLGNFIVRSNAISKERSLALEIAQKRGLFGLEQTHETPSQAHKRTPWGRVSEAEKSPELIPEKIRELMNSSPNHPEVEEIDASDEIVGVKFEAQDYPPVFGDGDGDDEE